MSRTCCFFFQAEDGIRDVAVTGVQTCALPIFFNLLNRINLSSGVGALPAFGSASPNGDVCAEDKTTHRCSANFKSTGFGMVTDTIGDFNGAPAIGPGESRNIQLVAKIIF